MSTIRKALVGALCAAVGAAGTGMLTATTVGGITSNEWWAILGGTLVAASGSFGAVWGVSNAGTDVAP